MNCNNLRTILVLGKSRNSQTNVLPAAARYCWDGRTVKITASSSHASWAHAAGGRSRRETTVHERWRLLPPSPRRCWRCPGDWPQGQRHQAPCQTLVPPEVKLPDFSFSVSFRDDDLLAGCDTTQRAGALSPLFAAVKFPPPPLPAFLREMK